jgi:hypothetical protein
VVVSVADRGERRHRDVEALGERPVFEQVEAEGADDEQQAERAEGEADAALRAPRQAEGGEDRTHRLTPASNSTSERASDTVA